MVLYFYFHSWSFQSGSDRVRYHLVFKDTGDDHAQWLEMEQTRCEICQPEDPSFFVWFTVHAHARGLIEEKKQKNGIRYAVSGTASMGTSSYRMICNSTFQ